MTWTSDTPIYLPLTDPPAIHAAAERLATAVADAMGARPELRHQPAPFGRAGVLLAPDPAYSAGIAPDAPETFVIVSSGPQLVITGADSLGTIYGIEWAIRRLVTIGEVVIDFTLPPWSRGERVWSGAATEPGVLLAHGYNTVCGTATEAQVACGLRRGDSAGDTILRDWFSELS